MRRRLITKRSNLYVHVVLEQVEPLHRQLKSYSEQLGQLKALHIEEIRYTQSNICYRRQVWIGKQGAIVQRELSQLKPKSRV